uniref:Caspase family p20 domain-containing protein n=1 Tax=Arion vulgaris TaxID=1028688 RepID=A0A0B7AYD5_9EUPU
MDEETVKRLELEIEELNRVEGDPEDLDTVDGFIQFIRKQLSKISGKFGKKSPDASATDTPLKSSSGKDFKEIKTAFISSETKHEGAGGYDNSDVYDFNHTDRGLALIINNEDFSGSKNFGPRPGSSYDATALYQTFRNLGFKVLVKTNLTARQMLEVLKLVKDDYDHANADCFVCSILTHGDEVISKDASERMGLRVRQDLLFGTDGAAVPTRHVVELFSDKYCPGLQGKPRLFFLQACRGSKYDHGSDILVSRSALTTWDMSEKISDKTDKGSSSCVDQPDNRTTKRQISSSSVDPPEYDQRLIDSTDAKPYAAAQDRSLPNLSISEVFQSKTDVFKSELHWAPLRDVPVCPTPLYKDCLVMYATPPGHFAWRRKNGAWFVQSLCEVLKSPNIGQVSLLKALVQTSRQVAFKYQSENPSRLDMHQKKEIPVIESMLVKDVFFIKKKK